MNPFQTQLLIGDKTLAEKARKLGYDVPLAPAAQKVTGVEFETLMREIREAKASDTVEEGLSDSASSLASEP